MSGHNWREDLELAADLARVNSQIASYILRGLDADAGHVEPISPADERTLGAQLVDLGTALQTRAARRLAPPTGLVIDETADDNQPAPGHQQRP